MLKKGWVSYRLSPRIEHQKDRLSKLLQKEVHFQQHGICPAFFAQPNCFFFRESKLFLDISKKAWESRH